MNIQICRHFCYPAITPKFIIEFADGKWYLQSESGCNSNYECPCIILEIEPMNALFKENRKQILKNWRVEMESLEKIKRCWRYVGGDPSYVLHNVRIVCGQKCPCAYIVEQTLSDLKHVERAKQVRSSEKISLSRVNIQ